MPGFASYDDLILEITTNGKKYERDFMKTSTAPEAAGVWHSLWTAAGTPGAGAAPAGTPGAAYTDAVGSMFFPNQASDLKFLISLEACANQNCTLLLYDRLVGVGAISVASTGNKTVNSAALTRYTAAAAIGVVPVLEVSTATTTTAPIVNLAAYTNSDGTGSRVGGNFTFPAVATNVDALMMPIPLAAGDVGVRSVETLNVGTAAAAGVVSVVLIRTLGYLPLIANIGNQKDFILQFGTIPRIYDGASLALAFLASGTTATAVFGKVSVAYG